MTQVKQASTTQPISYIKDGVKIEIPTGSKIVVDEIQFIGFDGQNHFEIYSNQYVVFS